MIDGKQGVSEFRIKFINIKDGGDIIYVNYGIKNATTTSPSLTKFMNTVQYVINYNSTYNLRASLREFVPTNLTYYFMYNGSDNDPECYPRLRFVAARYIHDLSQEDIKKFQRMQDQYGTSIPNNVRPLQDSQNRIVYRSFA